MIGRKIVEEIFLGECPSLTTWTYPTDVGTLWYPTGHNPGRPGRGESGTGGWT